MYGGGGRWRLNPAASGPAPRLAGVVQPYGTFVALEGGDGAGKSTQARRLAERLRASGHDVVLTREPGDCLIGPAVRAIVLDSAAAPGLSDRAEALLYAADRAQHVAEVIRPALARGALVVSDRYVDSSIAYQGAGRGLDPADVQQLSAFATGGLRPDLTVLLDLDPAVALARSAQARDRLESEPLDFHARVRAAFRGLAARQPERYAVVDAAGHPDDVAAAVGSLVVRFIAARAATGITSAAAP